MQPVQAPTHRRTQSRTRLAIAAVGVATLGALRPTEADPARVGEPYELAGKRLVFTNWIYVRSGDVGWRDTGGRFVNADESADVGPFDAEWVPTDHMPWGIRLRAHKPAEIRRWVIEPENGDKSN